MPIKFSGWEAICEKSRRLKPGQAPKSKHGYTMYHGTHKSNASAIISSGFRPSTGGRLGPGVYCSRDINKAQGYPAGVSDHDRVIFKLRVRVGKVKKIDPQTLAMQTTWHQNGYDTAWLPARPGGLEEDCVWDPKRITVVGIAQCSDTTTKTSLEQLIRQQAKKQDGGQQLKKCKACGEESHLQHDVEKCWGCKSEICPFENKHVCHKRG